MLEQLERLPPGLIGVHALGRVTREDYQRVMEPLLEAARRDGRRVRLVYEVGPEFTGFDAGSTEPPDATKVAPEHLCLFDGCAIVSDLAWLRDSANILAALTPFPMRCFLTDQRRAAIHWLEGLPPCDAWGQPPGKARR